MNKKRIFAIIGLVCGLATLVVGLVFLLLKLHATPLMADGDYLVSKGKWALEDGSNCETNAESTSDAAEASRETSAETNSETTESSGETNCINGSGVIWHFTEIGKGTLTTNNHVNDYEFAWRIDDDKIQIQTNWLYQLEDEFKYELDQGAGVLVLSNGDEQYRFVAQTE
ncbi:hypothetical protein IJG22_02215 [Candidatus Saccharibacteria bacterium]|nr:hypothetical protein [Candidatus Saccharibacteria bacterium]